MDFGGLAARMAGGLNGVRACLIVTRDGLTLGAHPAAEEHRAREAWDAVQSVGDVHRGFAEVGQELWAVARRGPYAAIMVASPEVRPGLLLDRMDTHLLGAERLRARTTEEQEAQATRSEPTRRPRTPLHPEPKQEPKADTRPKREPAKPALEQLVDLSSLQETESHAQREEKVSEPALPDTAAPAIPSVAAAANGSVGTPRPALAASVGPTPETPVVEAPAETPGDGAPAVEGSDGPAGTIPPSPEPARPLRIEREVDRIALAREFSRLLSDEFGGGK